MSAIALNTETLKVVTKTYDKPVNISDKKNTSIDLVPENKDILNFLYEHMSLTRTQKSKIANFLFAHENIGEVEVSSTDELFSKLMFLNDAEEPVFEVQLNNQWYPIMTSISKFKTFMGDTLVDFTFHAGLGNLQYQTFTLVRPNVFLDANDKPHKRTIASVMKDAGVRVTTKQAVENARKLMDRVVALSVEKSPVFDVHGAGLIFNDWFGFMEFNIGTKSAPAVSVVETALENRHYNRHYDGNWQLPFIRVFSFLHKAYVFADIQNMERHVYQRDGKEKIVLPQKMMTALNSIFNAKQENIFGDLFRGRHGGIVVLANGPSGVGKTLTAEVFAEHQERPLYTMEMGEIGTNLKEVEANLQKIFARAKKWNAVLLFDEADIFLSERVASDLERSAIVGIFLRLLDYYEGTFFLTTNRSEGIDNAFKSRVTLYLNYPELVPTTRAKIWKSMLSSAELEVSEDQGSDSSGWTAIFEAKLNGRQIRNQVRLLKMMYPDGNLTTKNIIDSLEFTVR